MYNTQLCYDNMHSKMTDSKNSMCDNKLFDITLSPLWLRNTPHGLKNGLVRFCVKFNVNFRKT